MGYNDTMWRCIPLLVLMGAPSLAHADTGGMEAAFKMLRNVELLIPDTRFERSFTEDDNRVALSWPIVLRAGHVKLGSAAGLGFNHMAEFQFEVTRGEFRGLLGERMMFHGENHNGGVLPFIEAGGLLGSDGSGAVVGGGLAYGDGEFGVSIGIVVRYVITNEERRGDIALDVQFPLNVL